MSVLHVLMSVLKDNSGAVALEYVITMVFAAVFIIDGLRKVIPVLKEPFSDVAVCLADIPNCASVVTAWIDGEAGETGGDTDGDNYRGNRSGLGDETNPGVGDGSANSPNEGEDNPGGQAAREAAEEAREAAREAAEEAREAAKEAAEEAREAAEQAD